MTDSEAVKAHKEHENRARHAAELQGLFLSKSRVRDKRGLTFGCYQLEYTRTGLPVGKADPTGMGYPFADLDQVEEWLNQGGQNRG